ncbi:MAG: 3-deoxy-manno-octulosonate cytidylyltransferase [Epsilonproteobacteria bacterium]|nr:3-deoxy-manno-octulosonate cytidylyltransferase [Campylobacterota bacterium]NPA64182.1 3-deoxy-manno-octulosonate cytidylyltransferase [Campylobacterota bacterium]
MIIIPARLASTRFPKKALYPIDGVPMVIHVAQRAKEVDEVVIATDAQEIAEAAREYGFRAVMTSKAHKSGTDRINEAATILGIDQDEIILNVQGDEPFIEPKTIQRLKEHTKNHPEAMICSLYKEVPLSLGDDPNSVKVVTDAANYALYFSRSLIPYPRSSYDTLKIHLGLYGYTKKMLERFCALEPAPLEQIEGLEQLRALWHGYDIAMAKVESKSFGIDTPQDLKRALAK